MEFQNHPDKNIFLVLAYILHELKEHGIVNENYNPTTMDVVLMFM